MGFTFDFLGCQTQIEEDLCDFFFGVSWLPNTKLLIFKKKNYFKRKNYENCWCGVDETRNVVVLMQLTL